KSNRQSFQDSSGRHSMKSHELARTSVAPTQAGVRYLKELGAAQHLGDPRLRRRLKDLRLKGGGPPYVRLGAAGPYRTDWLDKWAEENRVASTSEEAARRRDRGRLDTVLPARDIIPASEVQSMLAVKSPLAT